MFTNCSFSSELLKEEGARATKHPRRLLLPMEVAVAAGAESGPVAMPCDPCRSAYLCAVCYAQLHAPRGVCEGCERALAAVACRADAAAAAVLCTDCDVQVHSANAPPCRQHRFPVFPLSAAAAEAFCEEEPEPEAAAGRWWPLLDENYPPCGEFREYLDLTEYDYGPFCKQTQEDQRRPVSSNENDASECVVPSAQKQQLQLQLQQQHEASNCTGGSGYTASYSRSVSFSSMEAIAVPDTTMADTSNSYLLHSKGTIDLFSGPLLQFPLHFNSVDRKARVLRYREKRKTRKFEKTIRYASRKAYAESRPRIKGRFVKRSDVELKVDRIDVLYYSDILW